MRKSKSNEVIAILCSDIHLSASPPIARAGEADWFAAMAKPLAELGKLAAEHMAPILCAGDVFDRWNPSPELINLAIDCLPAMYAVPGQHDLPFHRYGDIQKSAYWTMVLSGIITTVEPGEVASLGGRPQPRVHGFPWGTPVAPPQDLPGMKIALVHEYTWTAGTGYMGAASSSYLNFEKYAGYDVVVIGDNHKPFLETNGKTTVLNCGGFMRRKSDDRHHPAVGLLHADASVTLHPLDISGEVFTELVPETAGAQPGLVSDFVKQLSAMQAATLDFRDAMMRAVEHQPEDVKRLILEAMG